MRGEGPEEPGPDRALVIGPVSLPSLAAVATHVGRIVGGETAQAVWRQQAPGATVHDGFLMGCRERAVREGDGQKLVRAQARVVALRRVEHVEAIAPLGIPEPTEARACVVGQRVVVFRPTAQATGKRGHAP